MGERESIDTYKTTLKRIHNPEVTGSTPVLATTKAKV